MSSSLLCLDVSSHAAGVAYFPSLNRDQAPHYLHVIKPISRLPTICRIDFIVAGVLETVCRFQPDTVVMEYTDGKVARRLKQRNPSGLAVMGQCQGEVRRALLCYESRRLIETVNESWTARKPKDERALNMAALFPIYNDFLRDGLDGSWKGVGEWDGKGLDAADAVGIGIYWINQENLRRAIERANH
jgi:Holliday junction resolvasome RuvABC endonuclease subunit